MKASNQFIEMLTEKGANYLEVASVLGVSFPTAQRICMGLSFNNETAQKIARAFPDSSPRQLFRRPFRSFEVWQRLKEEELIRGNGELTTDAKLRIGRKLWKITNPRRVRAQRKAHYWRKKKLLEKLQMADRQRLVQRLNRYSLAGTSVPRP